MKTKTFLLTLCSVFIIWSCEQDSSLSSLGGNSKLENEIADKALVANSGSTSNSRDILYHIHFDNATGRFILIYLPSDAYALLFGGTSGGELGGSGNSNKGTGTIAFPLPAESTPPTEQTLNYILDIYVTGENKILYPPLLLPYYHNATGMPIRFETGEEEQTEQYFDRNQYSDIFYNAKRSDFVIMKSELERADKIKYSNDKLVISNPAEGQEETTESTVFYIIKDDKMYFHIDPSSAIFTKGVLEVDKGTFHIVTYKTEWTKPVCSGGFYIIPIVTYRINVTLKLVKGDPFVNSGTDDSIALPVYKLYNILVSGQSIQIMPLENNNYFQIDDEDSRTFLNSAYYINQDGTISILNSNGIQIAKYPSYYTLIKIEEENKVLDIGGIPL